MLAAAFSGTTIVDVDPSSIENVEDLRQFLKLANCKLIYVDNETENVNSLKLLRQAIPEFYSCKFQRKVLSRSDSYSCADDDSFGQHFHSKYFPSLKFFVHTGPQKELGALNYKGLFIPHPNVNHVALGLESLSDDAVLYVKAQKGANGWELSQPVTHKQALSNGAWSFAKNLVNKTHFEGL